MRVKIIGVRTVGTAGCSISVYLCCDFEFVLCFLICVVILNLCGCYIICEGVLSFVCVFLNLCACFDFVCVFGSSGPP